MGYTHPCHALLFHRSSIHFAFLLFLFFPHGKCLFFLIAILIIINQLTAGHERGPLTVLSFPFCILHSLILSPPPILNH